MPVLTNNKVTYQPGEALPQVGSTEFKQAQSGVMPVQTTLNAESIANVTPMQPAQPAPETKGIGLASTLEAQAKAYADSVVNNQALEATKAKVDTAATSLVDRLLGRKTKVAETDTAYTQEGVDTAKKELNDINNLAIQEEVANRRQLQELEKTFKGTSGGLEATKSVINKQYLERRADLAVIQLAKQNNYALAKEIADRKVDAALEKDKNAVEALRFQYERDKDQYTKSEQRQFEAQQSERERLVKEKETKEKNLNTTRIELLKSANEQKAPVAVLQAIQAAKTPEEAINAAGQYGIDMLTRDIKLSQLATDKLQRAKLQNEIDMNTPVREVVNPDGTKTTVVNYTPKQLTYITKVNQDVPNNDTYKKTNSMQTFGNNVVASLSLGTGASDIAAINQFQKVIDEGAVTRDQDVKLIQSSQSLSNNLKTKITKLETGEQLSPELRKQMRETVEKLYDAQVKALLKDPYVAAKTRELELNGVKLQDTILGQLGAFTPVKKTTDTTSKSGGDDIDKFLNSF